MEKIIKKVLKIKIAAASVIALLIIALVIAGLIIFVPKSIKDTGLYYNDKGEAVTVSVCRSSAGWLSVSEPVFLPLSCGRSATSVPISGCSSGAPCAGLDFPIVLSIANAVPDTINAIMIVSTAALLALSAHIAL